MPRQNGPHTHTRTVASPAIVRLRSKPIRRMPAEVGEALRSARRRAGLTQEGLAARTAEVAASWQSQRSRRRGVDAGGVSRQTVSALETGSRSPSVRTAWLLIEALGLPRRDPVRKALLGAVSRSTRASRLIRSKVRRSAVLRFGARAAGDTVNFATGRLRAWEAERLRKLGRRRRKGGSPRRRARRGRW